MKINWLATTAIVISLGAGTGVAFAQSPDSPQRHEHRAGGQNPSMSGREAGHAAPAEARHMGGPSARAAQGGMREGAEARQRGAGPAAHEAAESRHQTVGQAGERHGREEQGSPQAASESHAKANRAGEEAHQASQPGRAHGNAARNEENKPAESAKSAQTERHGQELGRTAKGRNERPPKNTVGESQRHGQGAEHAAKSRHERNQEAAQPSRPTTSTAQRQGTHPGQTTGEARQHEHNGQAQTGENAGAQGREQTGQTQNEPNRRGQTASTQGTSTKINNQQRTKVVDRLRSDRDLERARSDVNIRVNVGERLPERVRPLPLPSDIVDIVPEYRGYDYTVVHDEIAIINPDTREIVDVIPERGYTAEGGGYSGGSYAEGASIQLSQAQREILRRAAFGSATVGSSVSSGPTCLSLRPVPDELARSNPQLASDKYLAIGDQVVLVDPHDQKIVQVINY